MSSYRVVEGAVVVNVRLTPKADRDEVGGVAVLADGVFALRARVRAVPERGAANDALVRLLARALRRPNSALRIVAGASGRMKQVRIDGDPASLAASLNALENA